MRRVWTNEEDIYLDENYSTTCNSVLTEYLGRTEASIFGRAHVLGLKKESVFSIYKGDERIGVGTAEELAEILDVKKKTIRYIASPSYIKRMGNNNWQYAVRV